MVTGGATQALILLCNVFFEKGDLIFAEEPISPTELEIFTDLGLNIVPGIIIMLVLNNHFPQTINEFQASTYDSVNLLSKKAWFILSPSPKATVWYY
jgi:hypothetical protein